MKKIFPFLTVFLFSACPPEGDAPYGFSSATEGSSDPDKTGTTTLSQLGTSTLDLPTTSFQSTSETSGGDIIACVTHACYEEKLIFITAHSYRGNSFGGLVGADIICNKEAYDGHLISNIIDYTNPDVFPFKAWLSGDIETVSGPIFVSAIDRIKLDENVKYVDIENKLIADGKTELLSKNLRDPINIDPFGNELNVRVWTNTSWNGIGFSSSNDCDNWTLYDSLSFSYTGRSNFSDEKWTMLVTYPEQNCQAYAHLYCVEQ